MIDSAVERASPRLARFLSSIRTLLFRVRSIGLISAGKISSRRSAGEVPTLGVADRQEQLLKFYARYEDLVDLLCDAAQSGPESKLEARYQELREWMQTHYPEIRSFAVAYLRYDTADALQSMEGQTRAGDAFEALFSAISLTEFLTSDDGHMISRISRTREALSSYADHLRRLAT